MINDRISDLITRIRNAYLAHKETVSVPHTLLLEAIVKVLVAEKYLVSYSVAKNEGIGQTMTIVLAYVGHQPALSTIKRISKPGVRMYTKSTSIRPVLSGMGIAILSTSQGIMTDRAAKKARIGGEVLFELW